MIQTEALITGVLFFVILSSVMAIALYRKLTSQGDTAMAKMKLHSEATINDFKALMYLHFFEAIVLFIFAIGGFTQNQMLLDSGRALTIVYGIGLTAIFYRWLRRF